MPVLGDREFRITAVGEKAWNRVLELGHVVLESNGPGETGLPGEIYVEETEGLGDLVRPGAMLEIEEASG